MRVVHAVWEKRNLGVDCNKIFVDYNDSVSDVKRAVDEYTTEYTIVKIPESKPEIGFMLEDKGFRFIETLMGWRYNQESRINSIPPIIERTLNYIEFREAGNDELKLVEQYILDGLFDTDYIYIDPYFTTEQATNRYVRWMYDELERGMPVWIMYYKEKAIGYIQLNVDDEGVMHTSHEGVFPNSDIPYAGVLLRYAENKLMTELGAKKFATSYISSNNAKSIRLAMQMRDELVSVQYVYVKHLNHGVI